MIRVGDIVRHRQIPIMVGTVVRVGPPVQDPRDGTIHRIYWKGWDWYDPEHIDWTWDFALEVLLQ